MRISGIAYNQVKVAYVLSNGFCSPGLWSVAGSMIIEIHRISSSVER